MTDAFDRAAAAEFEHLAVHPFGTAGQGGDRIRKILGAALDRDELTRVILARWHEFVAAGTELSPIAFAEQFAGAVVVSVLGYQVKDTVVQADDPTVRGRVLDVLFDGDTLTVKWFGGDVVTLPADQVRPA